MKEIESVWETRLISNQLQVIGRCPKVHPKIRPPILRLILLTAIDIIAEAKNTADCFVLSKAPKNIVYDEEDVIFISFTLIFRTPENAQEHADKLKNEL